MKKLIMTKGLPGSGKSTWAKEQVSHPDVKVLRVNKDMLRLMLHGGKWSKANEKIVVQVRNAIIANGLSHNLNVIVDDTNLAPIHEKVLRDFATQYSADFEIKDFTHVPVEQCIKQDLQRLESVGKDVIIKMFDEYLKPTPTVVVYDHNLPDCVICDVDGTIAKMNGRGPFEWHRVGEDLPIKHVIDMVTSFVCDRTTCLDKPVQLIFLSGRDEICRNATEEFILHKVGTWGQFLYMRKNKDSRKDYIVKKELYETNIKGKYNVVAVFDDRLQVCALWRELGLPLFQVGDGTEF